MRAVVTGATGFVGRNLTRHLRAKGVTVRTIDVRPFSSPEVEGTEHTLGDLSDQAVLETAFADADIVFHLAAKITLLARDAETWETNVHGAATIARAALARGVPRLVHCSSVHAFDLSRSRGHLDEQSPRSTSDDRPVYDRSKAAGEAEVRKVIDAGLDAVIVNPTAIYGPIDVGPSRVNRVLQLAARGRVPFVVGGGFDFVDVRDVVLGIVAAARHGRTGESYLLGGHRETALELARRAARATGHRGPRWAIPLRLVAPFAPLSERVGRMFGSDAFTKASVSTLAENPVVDVSKAARELAYVPRSLDDTIEDLVRSFGHSVRATAHT
jgi:dihydroflavonol-4-reductase